MSTGSFSDKTCIQCGAWLLADTRFCRQCGKAISTTEPGSITEDSTRILLTPQGASGAPPAQMAMPMAGNLYAQPQFTTQLPATRPTDTLAPKHSVAKWALGGVLMVLAAFLVLCAVGVRFAANRIAMMRHGSTASAPRAPKAPDSPITPAPPALGEAPVASDLAYPGAKTIMHVNKTDGGEVLQLETSDPFDKVVAWYTTRLKPSHVVNAGQSAVLSGDNGKAVINGNGDSTTVIVKR